MPGKHRRSSANRSGHLEDFAKENDSGIVARRGGPDDVSAHGAVRRGKFYVLIADNDHGTLLLPPDNFKRFPQEKSTLRRLRVHGWFILLSPVSTLPAAFAPARAFSPQAFAVSRAGAEAEARAWLPVQACVAAGVRPVAASADAARAERDSAQESALTVQVVWDPCLAGPQVAGHCLPELRLPELPQDDSVVDDSPALAQADSVALAAARGDSAQGGCWVVPLAAQRCERVARRADSSRSLGDDSPAVWPAWPQRADQDVRPVGSRPLLADGPWLPWLVSPEALP